MTNADAGCLLAEPLHDQGRTEDLRDLAAAGNAEAAFQLQNLAGHRQGRKEPPA